MKRHWNPKVVAKNREFRQKYGLMLDGRLINKVATYISVFAAASALFLVGAVAYKCGSDWIDSFSGLTFIVLGGVLWVWNGGVGAYIALKNLDHFALKHRHRLPVLRILVFNALLGIVITSGLTVSNIIIELEFRGSPVCLK